MRGEDRVLTTRIKQSRGFMREIIDLAELQSWTFRPKENGLLFFPPKAIVRPGFESVYAFDPGNDSSKQKHLRDRFRKAGMKFPEDEPPQRTAKVTTPNKFTIVPSTPSEPNVDAFELIDKKIDATVDLLTDIGTAVKGIKAEYAKVKAFREAMKALGNI